jgi:hypothetical protein
LTPSSTAQHLRQFGKQNDLNNQNYLKKICEVDPCRHRHTTTITTFIMQLKEPNYVDLIVKLISYSNLTNQLYSTNITGTAMNIWSYYTVRITGMCGTARMPRKTHAR